MKFDHIGIVVPTLSKGREHLAALFGITQWTREWTDDVNGVFVQFGRDASGICYELVAPLGENSPVAKTLAAGRTILNHVAYLVPNLESAAETLQRSSCSAIGAPNPAIAYGGHRIQFFMSPLRFIVELIEAPEHSHSYIAN